MSGYLLDEYPSGSVIYALWHTFDSNGGSVTMTGLAATDIEIFKNGSVTQRASDNGYTLLDTDGIDFDTRTGIQGISIDLADNSDASFYVVGSQYTVVIDAVTIDSQTVRFVLGSFRIMAAEGSAGVPKADVSHWNGTAVSSPATAGIPEVNVKNWVNQAVPTPNVTGVPKVDVIDWVGQTVPTPAQTGVPKTDPTYWLGTAIATPDTVGYPKVTIKDGTGTGEIDTTSGGVKVASFTAGAIDAAAIATGAVDADALATDAVDEIVAAVWVAASRTLTALDEDTTTIDLDNTIQLANDARFDALDTAVAALPSAATTAAAVWAATPRTLTALDEDTTTIDLDSTIQQANDARFDALDTAVAAIPTTSYAAELTAIQAKTDLIPGTQDGYTFAEHVLLQSSVLLGKSSGLDTTQATYRALDDTLDRVVAACDQYGNRSTVTRDTSSP